MTNALPPLDQQQYSDIRITGNEVLGRNALDMVSVMARSNIVIGKQASKKTKADAPRESKTMTTPTLRYDAVFNIDLVDGDSSERLWATKETPNSSPLGALREQASAAIAAAAADTRYSGDRA